jgi:hypothetical protein
MIINLVTESISNDGLGELEGLAVEEDERDSDKEFDNEIDIDSDNEILIDWLRDSDKLGDLDRERLMLRDSDALGLLEWLELGDKLALWDIEGLELILTLGLIEGLRDSEALKDRDSDDEGVTDAEREGLRLSEALGVAEGLALAEEPTSLPKDRDGSLVTYRRALKSSYW